MFTPEDFQLSLESQLKLRVINDEVDSCKDISILQEQLKASSELMMRYQTILHRILKEQLLKKLGDFTDKIKEDS
tara:strand:- start:3736 stop:3960 length:225 start_codon:yes stop_codon:yes gene_type:complete